MDKNFFTGKKVLVMGLGRFGGGVDAAKFAYNADAKVTITDLAQRRQLKISISQLQEYSGIEFHLGSHESADFEQTDIIIVNPAVPSDNKYLEIARGANKFITSQINIFFELCPAPIIGITGSNGKSTTAALTAHLLRNANNKRQATSDGYVWLSGNIGNEALLTIVDKIVPDDLVVLELSSFQLEQLAEIEKAPQVALLTNLTPNHLDRHKTFDNYCAAKETIFKFQKLSRANPAVSLFNSDDEIASKWFEKYSKNVSRTCIKFSINDVSEEIRGQFSLPGRANLSNLAAAMAIARYFDIKDEQIKASLPEFEPLPHRLEFIAEIDGVKWYNDSIATTPQSTIAALEAFEQPKIIIAGGYDKGITFDELGERIAQKAKAAILIGQTAEKIADAIENSTIAQEHNGTGEKQQIIFAKSLEKAVESARQLAVSGDIILLSPACASYDMFDNFQHRGQEFIKLVQKLLI